MFRSLKKLGKELAQKWKGVAYDEEAIKDLPENPQFSYTKTESPIGLDEDCFCCNCNNNSCDVMSCGLSDNVAKIYKEHGYNTLDDVFAAGKKKLQATNGIGPKSITSVIALFDELGYDVGDFCGR